MLLLNRALSCPVALRTRGALYFLLFYLLCSCCLPGAERVPSFARDGFPPGLPQVPVSLRGGSGRGSGVGTACLRQGCPWRGRHPSPCSPETGLSPARAGAASGMREVSEEEGKRGAPSSSSHRYTGAGELSDCPEREFSPLF